MSAAVASLILFPLVALHLAMRRDRRALAFQLAIDLALLLLAGRVLLAGHRLAPGVADGRTWGAPVAIAGSQEQSDFPLQFAVWWDEARRLAADGELPWITDRLGGGTPLFANGQSGLPFPLDFPVWLLGAVWGTAVLVVWKLELAALGAFLFLRRLGCRGAAAAMAGLVWGFAPVVLSWAVVPLSWVMAATPWALLLTVGALRGRRRDAALLAVLLGALAGWSVHPESAGFLWLAVALFATVHGWGRVRRLARLAAPLALALLVAACGAVPTLLTVRGSAKAAALSERVPYPDPGLTASTKLRVAALLFVPWREGRPQAGTWQLPFPAAPAVLSAGAVALVTLLGGSLRRRQRRAAMGLAGVGLAAAGLFFQVPGVAQAAAEVPVLQHMLWPRCGFLLTFALLCLGAVGLDGWSRRRRPGRLTSAALLVAVVDLALVLTAPRAARAPILWLSVAAPLAAAAAAAAGSPTALAAIAGVAVVANGWDTLPQSSPATPPAAAGAVQSLVARARGDDRMIGLDGALPANLAASLGLRDLRDSDPVRSVELARLQRALGVHGQDLPGPVTRPWAGLAGCWGVRWLITPALGAQGPWAAAWREVEAGPRARLYENPRALPPLRLAVRAVPAPPGDPLDGSWERVDFGVAAVVDAPPSLGGTGTLAVTEARPGRIVASVRAQGRVLAVLHVPHAVGWRAMLDGREVPIVTADIAAMGVVVGTGSHTVEWRYRPPGLTVGIVLTAIGLAGCAILAGHGRRRRW